MKQTKQIPKFNKDLIKIFAGKTMCNAQFNKCPCNSCFHNIEADFKHICWLIILGLRGDYEHKEILDAIREEIN